jgi:integrase
MPREAGPFQLRYRSDRKQWFVRFTLDGRQVERGLPGFNTKRQRPEAAHAAREIYAAHVQGNVTSKAKRPPRARDTGDLVTLAEDWLEALAVRDITKALFTKYTKRWILAWGDVSELTESAISLYAQARLKTVRGKTVRNELSALNKFLEWCQTTGTVATVPPMPKVGLAEGRPHTRRHRVAAPDLSDEEVRALIGALPERSGRAGWPVRARAVVAYATGLRPATLDKIRVPEHYTKGADTLRITTELDKEAFARSVPLSKPAREALDAICPDIGLVFGKHNMAAYMQAAALAALPPHKASVFCAQHFRSAAITRFLERSPNLAGVQYLVGHKHASTTSRYNRPTEKAARDVLRDVFQGRD